MRCSTHLGSLGLHVQIPINIDVAGNSATPQLEPDADIQIGQEEEWNDEGGCVNTVCRVRLFFVRGREGCRRRD